MSYVTSWLMLLLPTLFLSSVGCYKASNGESTDDTAGKNGEENADTELESDSNGEVPMTDSPDSENSSDIDDTDSGSDSSDWPPIPDSPDSESGDSDIDTETGSATDDVILFSDLSDDEAFEICNERVQPFMKTTRSAWSCVLGFAPLFVQGTDKESCKTYFKTCVGSPHADSDHGNTACHPESIAELKGCAVPVDVFQTCFDDMVSFVEERLNYLTCDNLDVLSNEDFSVSLPDTPGCSVINENLCGANAIVRYFF